MMPKTQVKRSDNVIENSRVAWPDSSLAWTDAIDQRAFMVDIFTLNLHLIAVERFVQG
jgi:hypothetical protein